MGEREGTKSVCDNGSLDNSKEDMYRRERIEIRRPFRRL